MTLFTSFSSTTRIASLKFSILKPYVTKSEWVQNTIWCRQRTVSMSSNGGVTSMSLKITTNRAVVSGLHSWRYQFLSSCVSYAWSSVVPARPGLKAPALAWPEVALASSNTRPRLFGICISTNKFNSFFFHKLLHSKSNQFSIQKTSLTSVY